jgi:hypothetical protein
MGQTTASESLTLDTQYHLRERNKTIMNTKLLQIRTNITNTNLTQNEEMAQKLSFWWNRLKTAHRSR